MTDREMFIDAALQYVLGQTSYTHIISAVCSQIRREVDGGHVSRGIIEKFIRDITNAKYLGHSCDECELMGLRDWLAAKCNIIGSKRNKS